MSGPATHDGPPECALERATCAWNLADEAATRGAAADLAVGVSRLAGAQVARPPLGLLIALEGPLGAGKSTFVRAFLRALGWAGRVPSPTYTLVEQYLAGGLNVAHLDLYRLADPEEIDALGGRELLSESDAVFIEWPGRGAGWLPPATLSLSLVPDGEGRILRASGRGADGTALAECLAPR